MKTVTLALMAVLLVGVALGKPQGHPNNCNNWCKNSAGQFTCCDKLPKCPVDNRPIGECNRPFGSAAAGVSGPLRCADDSSCGAGAICCPDKCLGYTVCKNL
ncbi:uncharacterized protein LOC135214862 [Macrobrachium nipponense]|uniref:uncharacterized protein LOC135214862 n=1 Tax=Macrobrachium nipponense TaxID=159736 RepID=UPI0030C8B593